MTLPSGLEPMAVPRDSAPRAVRRPAWPQGTPAQVMAYYFPQWHADPRNDAMFTPGWTEWDVLREGTPRFPGHVQPKRPVWGEYDESDPAVASRAVAAALDHGVDGFIVDWYWFDNAPFLNGFLDRGLLEADRLDDFRFAVMWANHEWDDLYPARGPQLTALLPAPNTRYHATCAFEHVLENYLTHPSYWRMPQGPYFSVYDLPGLIRGMGGVARTAELLDGFRERARAAGLPGLHVNGAINPGVPRPELLVRELGLDSATHYTWWHHPDSAFTGFPTTGYDAARGNARDTWRAMGDTLPVDYLPNVTVGWDPSPRTVEWAMREDEGYPFTSILTGNTPEQFGGALSDALDFAAEPGRPPVVTVNAWNEWTEGSSLEPEAQYGLGYLEAVREAVGAHKNTTAEGAA